MAKSYTQGDTIALLITALGTNVALSEYDITAVIYTSARAAVICASTLPARGEIEIVIRDESQFVITIPSDRSAMLRQGDYKIQTTYKHRTTGVQISVSNELFSITPKIHCYDHIG